MDRPPELSRDHIHRYQPKYRLRSRALIKTHHSSFAKSAVDVRESYCRKLDIFLIILFVLIGKRVLED